VSERIIEISENAAYLYIKLDNLCIERESQKLVTIPIEEIAALVLAHQQITLTQSVISRLSSTGAIIVFCDGKFMPSAMTLMLQGNFAQAERFKKQSEVSLPLKKRIWQQIVKAKVVAQSNVLRNLGKEDKGLKVLAQRVSSGDSQNIEAQAAQRYWPVLFNSEFRRRADDIEENILLNYGYAILRAITARAVCAAGLHPSLGLHHHNRYDVFCLASDLMEPFRPLIDCVVVELIQNGCDELSPSVKRQMLRMIFSDIRVENQARNLFSILSQTAQSLVAVLNNERKHLWLPRIEGYVQ